MLLNTGLGTRSLHEETAESVDLKLTLEGGQGGAGHGAAAPATPASPGQERSAVERGLPPTTGRVPCVSTS